MWRKAGGDVAAMIGIATIGFGEAARAFVAGWRGAGVLEAPAAAFDVKIENAGEAQALRAAAASLGVECKPNLAQALRGRHAVFSLVTADNAGEAAAAAVGAIETGAFFLDCNSCSPSAKARSARLIEEAGGRYVDVAVMSPVHPKLHRAPLLVAGPHAGAVLPVLERLGMDARTVGDRVGDASSIKMLRSVMIKGLEALTAECLLAARRAGVEEAVLASLQASDPGFDWKARSAYNLERMMVHGARRAAEMREVAATLRDLGLPDRMAAATADWQAEIAALGLAGDAPALARRADRILERLAE